VADHSRRREHLKNKLEETQIKFLRLLAGISDTDLTKKWVDEGWTIKEELVHVVQVLELIPSGIERAFKGDRRSWLGFIPAGFRGWVNGHIIIPRKAEGETRETIAQAYRDAHKILIDKMKMVNEDDWEKGMPYPRKYRTVEQIAYRPVEHFEEHEAHINQLLGMK